MSPFASSRAVFAAIAAAATLAAVPANAASTVSVELNRLEPKDNSCQISIVVANSADKAMDSLKLDLVFFDKEGVISRRLAVEAGPVRASKTSVKLFNAAETKCESIGRVLLNDVTACGGGSEQDCLAAVSTASRVKDVEFAK